MPSRTTSRHHWYIDIIIRIIASMKQDIPYPWNQLARPIARVKAPREDVSGQGLYSTK